MKPEFQNIDRHISEFVQDKDIAVDDKPKSDWLVFDWRQLSWERNGVTYIMELYPKFDKTDKIISWTFYSAAYFDREGWRHHVKKELLSDISLDQVEDEIGQALLNGYEFINQLDKQDIPRVLKLED